jgi:hypothetical protein
MKRQGEKREETLGGYGGPKSQRARYTESFNDWLKPFSDESSLYFINYKITDLDIKFAFT